MPTETSRRRVLQWTAGALTLSAFRNLEAASRGTSASSPSNPQQEHASDQAFAFLPLGEVMPAGWLKRQLRLQADGMTGHLHDFWPDVGENSGWLGGTGESWERGPYFVDGLLPLAVLLDDARLKALAFRFVEWTLANQRADGMIGPTSNNDWWPRMVMVKVLAQYFEATSDPRVIPVLTKYFHYQLSALPSRPLAEWGKYRWQDEVYVVQWLHARTDDPKLLELATLLRKQGFDWVGSFETSPVTGKVDKRQILKTGSGDNNDLGYRSHGVNVGQGLKTAAVQARMGDVSGNRRGFHIHLDTLDRYHGLPTGMFTCDEHLAGLSPSQGTELCTVVETMFSLEIALAVFGDATIGDRIEKIAYNALPATITADMWAHQYDQQVNQVQCSLNSKPWTTNSDESNLFGLEPHFGCCTANYHQGWPKLVASLWMRTPDDGLAATLYGPCEVHTRVKDTQVRLREETEYPFRETVALFIEPERPVNFPLKLRIPEWASGATLLVNGKAHQQVLQPGTFATVEREWRAGDRVELKLPMQPRVSRWLNRSIAVARGPLLYSHSPGENWVELRDRGPVKDWQVFPSKQWNYALRVNEDTVSQLKVQQGAIAAVPFAAESRPVTLDVPAQILDAWRSEDGVAPPPPASPVAVKTPVQTITLVPYGTARLRISVFPEASV